LDEEDIPLFLFTFPSYVGNELIFSEKLPFPIENPIHFYINTEDVGAS